uniref:MAM domain-containing protein n=1 Tax=Panagrellus redivivus TaxID=6233 RepID=A0A7E4UP94_PANRE
MEWPDVDRMLSVFIIRFVISCWCIFTNSLMLCVFRVVAGMLTQWIILGTIMQVSVVKTRPPGDTFQCSFDVIVHPNFVWVLIGCASTGGLITIILYILAFKALKSIQDCVSSIERFNFKRQQTILYTVSILMSTHMVFCICPILLTVIGLVSLDYYMEHYDKLIMSRLKCRGWLICYIYLLWMCSIMPLSDACSGSSGFAAARSRAAALGAPNVDSEMRAAKCQRADFGIYRAEEIRSLATVYEIPGDVSLRTIVQGGNSTCFFDAPTESCAWFSTDALPSPLPFRRARFETVFDYQRFDCTSDRTFSFDDYFLLAGGEPIPNLATEGQAAMEIAIPCQLDNAMLKFQYWSNNETPILKVCIIPEDTFVPNCEESKFDENPLTFEIPSRLEPFRIRIQVDHLGPSDIVLVDKIIYEGTICELVGSDGVGGNAVNAVGDENYGGKAKASGTTNELAETAIGLERTFATLAPTLPTMEAVDIGQNGDLNQVGIESGETAMPPSSAIVKDEEDGDLHSELTEMGNEQETETALNGCKALVCNFNFGDACNYRLSGLASTASWQIGSSLLGNPHTGIHKPSPKDNTTGFLYVGLDGNDFSKEVFVLESPAFHLNEPAYLTFDLYQRSMGPQLKVCIDSFEDCPYSNPALVPDQFWHLDQRVFLPDAATKVYFLAAKVRQNLYLAIDNIRLLNVNGVSACPSDTGIPGPATRRRYAAGRH